MPDRHPHTPLSPRPRRVPGRLGLITALCLAVATLAACAPNVETSDASRTPSTEAPAATAPPKSTTPPATAAPTTTPPTTAPSTTAAPTTAPSTTAPPTTAAPTTTAPTTTVPGSTTRATATNTGPRVANPANVGRVEVFSGQTRDLVDVVASALIVHPGAKVTARNVRIDGPVAVLGYQGRPAPSLRLIDSSVYRGMTVNVHDSKGNLVWAEVPVDVVVEGSWIRRHQGSGQEHTNALAGFGYPRGARFVDSTLVQQGPYNNTATAVMNWHGADTVFDRVLFTWESGTAAHYTMYVSGRNNVVKNSAFSRGLSGYIFPDSPSPATYIGNVDAVTSAPVGR